jgi:hypothetical protein
MDVTLATARKHLQWTEQTRENDTFEAAWTWTQVHLTTGFFFFGLP